MLNGEFFGCIVASVSHRLPPAAAAEIPTAPVSSLSVCFPVGETTEGLCSLLIQQLKASSAVPAICGITSANCSCERTWAGIDYILYFNYDGWRLKHDPGKGSGKRLERAE